MIPIKYNVRSLAVRRTTTLATALGIALVVFVLASALMLAAGVKKTLAVSGAPDVAIVLRKGSDAELGSVIDAAEVNRILGAPGVKRDAAGKPIGAGEIVVVAAMEKLGANGLTNVQIRGVTDEAANLRPGMKIIDGRAARPGSDEVIVGKRIRGRFKGVELGDSFELRKNRPVKVVGVFEAGGSSYESEIWVDVDTLRAAYARQGAVSSVRVELESPAAFDGFKTAMEGEKAYGYQALREGEYFEKLSEGTSIFINAMGGLIAFFFALGAMVGAMITMYAAVANRQREIGTLRALGFSRASILVSFLAEALILALFGGALGTLASLGMSFVHFSMINFASWSEIVFSFDPTPKIIVTSLVFAGGMGLAGGFFPALRASEVSPVVAMRG
ncbi:MAG TPA: FtsX-like permease family protein [Minicystis sp.]|nr:FtsX-like permease family protein [Minicystis sp.]